MAELKREYVVPLRRKTNLAPKWRRSKKAVSVLKEFIRKHMKTENIVICKELNDFIWLKGGKNPPGKVSVIALKSEFNGEEKTLVNLLDSGIENQMTSYNVSTSKVVPIKDEKVTEKKIEDVKEEETNSKKVEDKKKESKEKTNTKKVSKEEVKNG